ncbi:TatD family deoxyribonuclease [Acutalibacter sp. 1XD8-33]|uniref:TatD family hydrolase n=1 Tax=Acutalibacter sp. 1XD8-33 TaxID=2320081 RepID=UPI000EA219FE|nr:TatD family hydrolase [Acutalibacter sp. 1XD8-33]RKJ39035.1 TatD family deoxyribonuclease [Acutalibacter sp. 1XD8-33]
MDQELYTIYDSHAHYDAEAFDEDRAWLLGQWLPLNGVKCVINMGTRLRTCASTVGLADLNPYVFAAVGIHPEEIDDSLPENWLDCLKVWLESSPKVVAIGEIGLDYHWEDCAPRQRQMEVFSAQLALAGRMGLPVCVHDRDAHADTLSLLRHYRPQGVLHCFSGSAEMAREVVELGMYIGLGGVVTFKNARKAVEVARAVPLDRLLLETDAPYMSPEPYRGKRNDSAKIPYTAEKIAEIRGISTKDVLNASNANIRRLFNLEGLLDQPSFNT